MKYKIESIDISCIAEEAITCYIIKFKKHWWNKWIILIDERKPFMNIPLTFIYREDCEKYLHKLIDKLL